MSDIDDRKKMLVCMDYIGAHITDDATRQSWYKNGIENHTFSDHLCYDEVATDSPLLWDGIFRYLMDQFLDTVISMEIDHQFTDNCLTVPSQNRKKALVAMEYIARQINDEDVFMGWLMTGVPDGDIEYGNLDPNQIDDDDSMLEDSSFYDIVDCFLRRMTRAHKSGGLYCGDICTEAG